MKIYHNPRCRKSREALAYLEENKLAFQIVEYLKNPLTPHELEDILEKLNFSPLDLIRKNEKEWKENFKGKTLTDSALVKLMCDSPKLMERPIIVTNSAAVVARPLEQLVEFIKKL